MKPAARTAKKPAKAPPLAPYIITAPVDDQGRAGIIAWYQSESVALGEVKKFRRLGIDATVLVRRDLDRAKGSP